MATTPITTSYTIPGVSVGVSIPQISSNGTIIPGTVSNYTLPFAVVTYSENGFTTKVPEGNLNVVIPGVESTIVTPLLGVFRRFFEDQFISVVQSLFILKQLQDSPKVTESILLSIDYKREYQDTSYIDDPEFKLAIYTSYIDPIGPIDKIITKPQLVKLDKVITDSDYIRFTWKRDFTDKYLVNDEVLLEYLLERLDTVNTDSVFSLLIRKPVNELTNLKNLDLISFLVRKPRSETVSQSDFNELLFIKLAEDNVLTTEFNFVDFNKVLLDSVTVTADPAFTFIYNFYDSFYTTDDFYGISNIDDDQYANVNKDVRDLIAFNDSDYYFNIDSVLVDSTATDDFIINYLNKFVDLDLINNTDLVELLFKITISDSNKVTDEPIYFNIGLVLQDIGITLDPIKFFVDTKLDDDRYLASDVSIIKYLLNVPLENTSIIESDPYFLYKRENDPEQLLPDEKTYKQYEKPATSNYFLLDNLFTRVEKILDPQLYSATEIIENYIRVYAPDENSIITDDFKIIRVKDLFTTVNITDDYYGAATLGDDEYVSINKALIDSTDGIISTTMVYDIFNVLLDLAITSDDLGFLSSANLQDTLSNVQDTNPLTPYKVLLETINSQQEVFSVLVGNTLIDLINSSEILSAFVTTNLQDSLIATEDFVYDHQFKGTRKLIKELLLANNLETTKFKLNKQNYFLSDYIKDDYLGIVFNYNNVNITTYASIIETLDITRVKDDLFDTLVVADSAYASINNVIIDTSSIGGTSLIYSAYFNLADQGIIQDILGFVYSTEFADSFTSSEFFTYIKLEAKDIKNFIEQISLVKEAINFRQQDYALEDYAIEDYAGITFNYNTVNINSYASIIETLDITRVKDLFDTINITDDYYGTATLGDDEYVSINKALIDSTDGIGGTSLIYSAYFNLADQGIIQDILGFVYSTEFADSFTSTELFSYDKFLSSKIKALEDQVSFVQENITFRQQDYALEDYAVEDYAGIVITQSSVLFTDLSNIVSYAVINSDAYASGIRYLSSGYVSARYSGIEIIAG